MLKRRLIPKLQLGLRRSFRGDTGVLVITNKFSTRQAIGDPVSQAKIYEAQLADELILVDIERTEQSWAVLLHTLKRISETLATPLAVGGGIKDFRQVQELLDLGADKVVLNSAALDNPGLIDKIASRFGSQCLVLSVDVRGDAEGGNQVWRDSGSVNSQRDALSWVQEAVGRGCGELMLTDIERDGSGKGLNLRLIDQISKAVPIPVIASGGCGLAQHFVDGYRAGAAAVAAGTFFCRKLSRAISQEQSTQFLV